MEPEMHQGRVAGSHWDPRQYARFGDHRLRPALELLARVPLEQPRLIYDLGCGSGQITRMIAERWPSAEVVGIDHSPEMLAQAAALPSPVQWVEADIGDWLPASAPDLIFSNAALQWVGDHDRLFPQLAAQLAPGGCLAVQMPLSWGLPSHRLMREVLADGGPQGAALGSETLRQSVAHQWVAEPMDYYDWLAAYAPSPDIWTTRYLQVLEGENPVVEWVKGTGLRPILHDLDGASRAAFVAEYRRRIALTYPRRADGHTVYPFERLFIIASRVTE